MDTKADRRRERAARAKAGGTQFLCFLVPLVASLEYKKQALARRRRKRAHPVVASSRTSHQREVTGCAPSTAILAAALVWTPTAIWPIDRPIVPRASRPHAGSTSTLAALVPQCGRWFPIEICSGEKIRPHLLLLGAAVHSLVELAHLAGRRHARVVGGRARGEGLCWG